jgi:hypothetical protein
MNRCIICARSDRDLSLVGMCHSCEHDWNQSGMFLGDYVQYAVNKSYTDACKDASV